MEQKNQSKKKAAIAFAVTAIIVLVFGTIIAVNVILNNKGDGTTEDKVDVNIIKAVAEYNSASIIKGDENNGVIDEHVRGNANAKVLVVEYADLQCPGCAAMMTSVHNLYIQYSDEVMFIFRNFPINGHPNARPAAAAAEAAGFFPSGRKRRRTRPGRIPAGPGCSSPAPQPSGDMCCKEAFCYYGEYFTF